MPSSNNYIFQNRKGSEFQNKTGWGISQHSNSNGALPIWTMMATLTWWLCILIKPAFIYRNESTQG
jgi:hypothetical protein